MLAHFLVSHTCLVLFVTPVHCTMRWIAAMANADNVVIHGAAARLNQASSLMDNKGHLSTHRHPFFFLSFFLKEEVENRCEGKWHKVLISCGKSNSRLTGVLTSRKKATRDIQLLHEMMRCTSADWPTPTALLLSYLLSGSWAVFYQITRDRFGRISQETQLRAVCLLCVRPEWIREDPYYCVV